MARPGGMDLTVIVTGAGGPAGVSVIRALREQQVRVVAADADPLAVGLRLADEAAVLPRYGDPAFVDRLCDVALRNGADALISTVAEEMARLGAASEQLATAGLRTWLPSQGALEACVDKWRLAQVVRTAGVTAPMTRLGSGEGVPGPWIVKPRFGRGSRHVYSVNRPQELTWAIERVPDPIVQTRVEGLEFTVDALVDRDGALAGAVPRWRLETKAGISTKGRTFRDDTLMEQLEALLDTLQLQGPANVQGFLVTEDGSISFVEVNPRFSGGLPLSLAAGADLVGEYLRGVIGLPIRRRPLKYRTGVTMTRYFEDVFQG
jgi:carbamoyl-phosphate synthase large subunit